MMEALFVLTCRFEQAKRTLDVGFNKCGWAENGPVDMGFGREMHDNISMANQVVYQSRVTDIPFNNLLLRVRFDVRQTSQIAGIGERVQVNELIGWAALEPIMDKVAADKASSAGY